LNPVKPPTNSPDEAKKALSRHWALIFADEASFRQDSTLHATWSRVGCPPKIPVTGERKNVKILGTIELWRTRFDYRQDTVFKCHHLSRLSRTTGSADIAPGRDSDSGQRFLSPESGVKTSISGLKWFEPADPVEYVADQIP
jgi:hypothetical protein